MPLPPRRPIGADVLVPFILLALVFGGLFWQKYKEAYQLPTEAPETRALTTQKAVLFFVDDNGRLSREAREIAPASDRTAFLRSLLEELFSGPVSDLTAPLPEWTNIHQVSLEGNLAVIDLSRDFATALEPGSAAEMLAVYAIVNTVAANLPEVEKVKITLEGDPSAHLRHLDLSEPLAPDYTLEAPATNEQGRQQPK